MLRTLIFTVFFIIVFFLAKYFGVDSFLHPKRWLILGFFVAFSFLMHRLIDMGLQGKEKNFIAFYLAATVLRLILSLVFIGIELYFGLQQQELFIINFFVLYLFYTVFEIWNLSRNLRQNSGK
ncbi:hypothetical protein Emtol_4313 [Emticicia oligotrophica DSM 17448]|uniref:Uncharacterized protein n=1 Tax=Emticicia oligotrophica (strain DSM 17448 / CIP 109782 / MTCC 6937 / GPTSA100-15) TaxID=929562 RepID=A0ABN4AU09_EMTOG|nr:hypothetical protein [Emticicia oligotrophica]AFK05436.1 hypothetical protein Emtol_4313 [Emticicia oligotrophica DSM 17448]